MALAASPPAGPVRRRTAQAARIELIGLAAASLVTVAAVTLAVAAKSIRTGDIASRIAAGHVVALNEAPDAGRLVRVLGQSWPDAEARAIAGEIRSWLSQHEARNVGALAQIRMPAGRVRADAALESARARLDAALERGRPLESIPLLTGSDLARLKPSFVVRRLPRFQLSSALSLLLLLASFYGLHALRRVSRSAADPLILPIIHLLCGIGLALMIGLRDPVRDLMMAPAFTSGVALGALVAAAAWRAAIDRMAVQYAPLAAALVLSLLLVVFGTGPAGSDARVNLWGFQPVEVIRLLVLVYLAAFFARQWQHLRSLRDVRSPALLARSWRRGRPIAIPPLEYIVPVAAALTLVAAFFAVQRDLGPALVFGCVFLMLWAVATRRAGLAAAGLLALAAGFWLVVRIGFPSTLATRVAMAADPWTNAMPGGDQVAHAFWGFATGGAAGTGAGMGEPQYIPAGHTDLILAVLGEELGFAGVLAIALAYCVLCHRALRIAMRAPTDFTCFLTLGLTFSLFTQLALIAAGGVGLIPLSGVVTPFLSYGRTAMIANFAIVGALLSVSGAGEPRPREAAVRNFGRPMAMAAACLATLAVLVVGRVFHAQVWAADQTMTASALVRLGDGTVRFEDNPRLLAAAREYLERGDISDRNGIVVATSNPASLRNDARALARFGIDPDAVCGGDARCYPFGGRMYHVLGDANTELDWTASNTSFIERDSLVRLQGFNDFERPVTVQIAGSPPLRVMKHRYEELVPLVRYRYRPTHSSVQTLRARPRNLRLTIDARLQMRVADLLREGVRAAGSAHGAAAVVDAATGEVLAAVSYPWPEGGASGAPLPDREARLDRLRYGIYPPGSTFKLVTAAATLSLRPDLAGSRHMCVLLPDGRAGVRLPGAARAIRDDALDTHPHGELGLDAALRVSCNAYFAQLARRIGPDALYTMASRFDIDVAHPNTPARLREYLPYAAFGQGETLASPMRMLGVTAAIAAGGNLAKPRWILDGASAAAAPARVMTADAASRIGRDMADVVTSGTGRAVAGVRPAIAGKTGTAEVNGGRSHAWFTGFAPAAGRGRRLAFVVLVENGGYGGRAAAPIAGQIVQAARELHLFDGE